MRIKFIPIFFLAIWIISARALTDAQIQEEDGLILSRHMPKNLSGTLGLNANQLKVFGAGALNMLSAKCPALPHKVLGDIKKFISKILSKKVMTEIKENSGKVKDLVKTLSVCSNSKTQKPQKHVKHVEAMEAQPDSPKEQPRGSQEQKQVQKLQNEGIETIKVRNFESNVPDSSEEHAEVEEKPTPRRNRVYTFLTNVWSTVRNFFHTIFGGQRRSRRSTEVVTPKKNSFGKFFDESCRIFCAYCEFENEEMMNNFKRAAQELLNFLFKEVEKEHLEAAANFFLKQNILTALEQC